MKGRFVASSLKQVASVFGVQTETVRTWISKGCPCEVGTSPDGGRYDIAQMIRWCRKHVWVPKQNGGGGGGSSPSEAELRKKILQITFSERALSLKLRMGRLVDRELAKAEVRRQYAVVRARLEAIPHEAAATITGEIRTQVIQEWKHLIRMVLRELSGNANVEHTESATD